MRHQHKDQIQEDVSQHNKSEKYTYRGSLRTRQTCYDDICSHHALWLHGSVDRQVNPPVWSRQKYLCVRPLRMIFNSHNNFPLRLGRNNSYHQVKTNSYLFMLYFHINHHHQSFIMFYVLYSNCIICIIKLNLQELTEIHLTMTVPECLNVTKLKLKLDSMLMLACSLKHCCVRERLVWLYA